MNNVSMSDGSLMAQIQVDTMKKAMQTQEREVLSVLQSATAMQTPAQSPSQPQVAALTGLGRNLDLKG